MEKTVWGGTVLTSPVPPVMVSCGDFDAPNIITVAWTGTVNTKPPMTYISLRPTRHSYGIIKEKREFVINLTPTSLIKEADFCGIYTGAKVNKFEKCRFTKEKASKIDTPLIAESPINLECIVKEIIPLGTHDMFLAEIVAVNVDSSLIDKNGKLHIENAELSAFAHGDYYSLGKKLAPFGCSVKKKHPKRNNTKKTNK
ncbi:MAG: flavin reductase family protein [Clostridia bacterium]|nr:flavin reductase family protein [Clostridia bacterium]